jgi:hypothetical protein
MRTSTDSVRIEARPEDVFAFVADPRRLPVWAIGFAKAIREEASGWIVTVGSGAEVPIRVDSDPGRGTVDFFLASGEGTDVPAMTRVMANGDGAEYVFTMFQPPGMPDEAFAGQVAELRRELVVLKAHLESRCPL